MNNEPKVSAPSAAQTAMVSKAARVLSDGVALACGVNADDVWKLHSEIHFADAQAALEACGALDLLDAAEKLVCDPAHVGYRDQARAAIAKAAGGAA